jgi:hypothetical protein
MLVLFFILFGGKKLKNRSQEARSKGAFTAKAGAAKTAVAPETLDKTQDKAQDKAPDKPTSSDMASDISPVVGTVHETAKP